MRNLNRPDASPTSVADFELRGQSRSRRPSVLGRPRALTRAQIAQVLAWYDSRVTLKQLASSLGVSRTTLGNLIKSRGTHYKQAPPEERTEALRANCARRRELQAANWL